MAAVLPRVIRYADLEPGPWRNGGGITREILTEGTDEASGFTCRISVAEITAGGPFSSFPGVDRVLTLCGDTEMVLTVDGQPHRLRPFDVLPFSGDVPASAVLVEGPTIDLNVMTRRGTATATVSVDAVADHLVVSPAPDESVLLVLVDGSLVLGSDDELCLLELFDTVVLGSSVDHIRLAGQGRLARIVIQQQQRSARPSVAGTDPAQDPVTGRGPGGA